MNSIDTQYQALLKHIMLNGTRKETRNGPVISTFGRQIRHNMAEGFPLLTTKKMYWKGIVTELLWFLRGDTNIKFLIDNNCHIWDGDCFANYIRNFSKYVDSLPENGEAEFIINKDKFINKIKTDDEFAEKWGSLGPVYGKQWRSWDVPKILTIEKGKIENGIGTEWGNWERNPIDQIANLISELKTNPDSRRLMVNAWNVGELDSMVLPPCHYGFQVYTRELSLQERQDLQTKMFNGLHYFPHSLDGEEGLHKEYDKQNVPRRAISLMWNQRSVDTFLGLPFNIASYGLLLEILAKEVNMVPDELIGNLGDVHLYQNHWNQANEQYDRVPYALPKLRINTEFWNPENVLGDNYDAIIKGMQIDDFQIENYQSHPSIKAPLSN